MDQPTLEGVPVPQAPAPPARPAWRSWLMRGFDAFVVAAVVLLLLKFFVAPRIFRDAVVPAPSVNLAALDGGRFSVKAQHGQVVFLDFYASWCEPCKLSMPLVEHYAREHPEARIFAVDVGERPEFVRAFAREHRMRNVVLDPDQKAADAFGVTGFPTIVVIDPNGMVRARWEGFNPAIESAMGNAQATFSATAHPPA